MREGMIFLGKTYLIVELVLRSIVHVFIGAAMGLLGGLAAEFFWPHGCLEYLPLATAVSGIGGWTGGWYAGAISGPRRGTMFRWGFLGAGIGGLLTGFSFFGVLFLQCWGWTSV